jgi:hypothetical protein
MTAMCRKRTFAERPEWVESDVTPSAALSPRDCSVAAAFAERVLPSVNLRKRVIVVPVGSDK